MSVTIVKLKNDRWLVEIGGTNHILTSKDLDVMAQSLAFRLEMLALAPIASGYGIIVSPDMRQHIHLCFSEELDDVISTLIGLRTERDNG